MDPTDADGYVVYYSTLPQQPITSLDVGNTITTSYTIDMLISGTTYNVTVRAYQDLLGSVSQPIMVTTEQSEFYYYIFVVKYFSHYFYLIILLVMIHYFNWTLLSEHSSQVAQYRMDCITQYAEKTEVTLIHNNNTVTNGINQEYINITAKLLNSSVVLNNSLQNQTTENQKIECKVAELRSYIVITGSFILLICTKSSC